MIISLLSSFVVFWIEHNQSKHHRKFSNKRYFLVRNIFLLNSWILVDAYLTNYIMTFPYHYIAGITLKKKNNFLLNETTLKHLENYLKHDALFLSPSISSLCACVPFLEPQWLPLHNQICTVFSLALACWKNNDISTLSFQYLWCIFINCILVFEIPDTRLVCVIKTARMSLAIVSVMSARACSINK